MEMEGTEAAVGGPCGMSVISQTYMALLKPGDRVPSENELVESMNVSRMTANRALRELNDEGYVERIAGRGTFVADYRSQSHLLEVQNIADEIVHEATAGVDAQRETLVLAGSEIDFSTELIGAAFKINNPNATAACGCGTSFSI